MPRPHRVLTLSSLLFCLLSFPLAPSHAADFQAGRGMQARKSEFREWFDKAADAGTDAERIDAYTRALKGWRSADGLKSKSQALFKRGLIFESRSDFIKAVTDYDDAIRFDPKSSQLHFHRGFCFFRRGELDKALEDYDEVVRLRPKDADAFQNRGAIHYHKKDYDKAIADYDQALKLLPSDAGLHNKRGKAFFDKGELDKAIADFQKALELDPNSLQAEKNLAEAKNRKSDVALKPVSLTPGEEAPSSPEVSPKARDAFERGKKFLGEGDREHAADYFEQAVGIQPANAEYRNWLASALYEQADYNGALEQLQKVPPGQAWSHILGLSLLKLQRFEEAEEVLRKGVLEGVTAGRGTEYKAEMEQRLKEIEAYHGHLTKAREAREQGRWEGCRKELAEALSIFDTSFVRDQLSEADRALSGRGKRAWLNFAAFIFLLGGGTFSFLKARSALLKKSLLELRSKLAADPSGALKAFRRFMLLRGNPSILSPEEFLALYRAPGRTGDLLPPKLRPSPQQLLELINSFCPPSGGPTAPASPELHSWYKAFAASGASQEAFTAEQIYWVYSSSGHEAELFPRPPGLSDAQTLGLAAHLSQALRHQEAVGLVLDDKLILASAATQASLDRLLAILDAAGKLDEFLATQEENKPDDFFSALAASLLRANMAGRALKLLNDKTRKIPGDFKGMADALLSMGRKEEALKTLASVPKGEWTAEDAVAVFTLFLRHGQFELAKGLYERVLLAKPVRAGPDLHYGFALQCEKAGDTRQAIEIYGRFETAGLPHKDVSARLAALRGGNLPPAGDAPAQGKSLVGGKYILISVIGEGGMGTVYAAHDRALDRKVAIKKMRPEFRDLPRERTRFLQEARSVARVQNPYVVAIHEILEVDGEIFLVFDFVEGKTLAQILDERGKLALDKCKAVFRYVCQAVDCAHRLGVLHRDLKAGNIIIGRDGFARVMDFGLARVAKDTISKSRAGEISGTPAYMAPEEHLGKSGKPGDIFSMGVMLYEMLTGELPFTGPDYLAQKERRLYPPVSTKDPSLPKGIDAFLTAVLEPDPDKRIQSVADFLQRLSAL